MKRKYGIGIALAMGGSAALVGSVALLGIYGDEQGEGDPVACRAAYGHAMDTEESVPQDRPKSCRGLPEKQVDDIIEDAYSDHLRDVMDVPGDAPEEDSDAPIEVGLRETAKWRDGVSISLSQFSHGTSGRDDAPSDTPYVKFKIHVENGGEDLLDLSAMAPECGLGAEGVFMDGVDGWLDSHVKPGGSVEWTASCSVLNEDMQVEITPSAVDSEYLHRTGIFSGQVKEVK